MRPMRHMRPMGPMLKIINFVCFVVLTPDGRNKVAQAVEVLRNPELASGLEILPGCQSALTNAASGDNRDQAGFLSFKNRSQCLRRTGDPLRRGGETCRGDNRDQAGFLSFKK